MALDTVEGFVGDKFAAVRDAFEANLASGAETIETTLENGRQVRNLRMALLVQNWGHNSEIYGLMTAYMRMKSIVPPSSER